MDALRFTTALLEFSKAVNDGDLLAKLAAVRDQAVLEQKNLSDLHAQSRAIVVERKQLEKDKDEWSKSLAAEKAAIAAQRAQLDRDIVRHRDAAEALATAESKFSEQHKAYLQFKAAVS
jgi:hypothetical protein